MRWIGFAVGVSLCAVVAATACVGDSSNVGIVSQDGAAPDSSESTADGSNGGGDSGPSCTKTCFGMCADVKDPRTGCAASACDPCPAGAHQTASCAMNGACAVACDTDYSDCANQKTACATHTGADPMNCGGCKIACGAANTTAASTCTDGQCIYACAAGYAHCSKDPSTGCDTLINSTDANNCGACGHSCQGGTCVAGVCQPVILAKLTAGDYPTGLALDGTNAYITAFGGHAVYKVPINTPCGNGGQAACVQIVNAANSSAAAVANPNAITTDGTYVFWANSAAQTLYRATVTGTSVTQVGSSTSILPGVGLAGGKVWYSSRATPYLRTNGVAATGTTTQVDIVTGNGGDIESLSFDAMFAYAADPSAGVVLKLPLASPICQEFVTCNALVPSAPNARGLANDANNVYWAEGSNNDPNGKVRRIGKAAGGDAGASGTAADVGIHQDMGYGEAVATDGVNVYWGSLGAAAQPDYIRVASVTAAACDGTACKHFADGNKVAKIVVDDVAVYWTNQGADTVMKLAK
jgi:hypothetical protein